MIEIRHEYEKVAPAATFPLDNAQDNTTNAYRTRIRHPLVDVSQVVGSPWTFPLKIDEPSCCPL